jgi:hypothetical protein
VKPASDSRPTAYNQQQGKFKMAVNQVGDGSADGVQTPNTKLGFYGATPVAIRATNSIHVTSNLSAISGGTSALTSVGSWIVEVTNTLIGLGLWTSP